MKSEPPADRPFPSSYGQCIKRDRIMMAAEQVFAREGFAAGSIDMIAVEAGVSRQTVYNHWRDKETLFRAVVRELTERSNAELFATAAAFPDRPDDLESALVAFAEAFLQNCMCNRDGQVLRRIIEAEGARFPEILDVWREHGPAKLWSLVGAGLGRLAGEGYLAIPDAALAARQFIALVRADIELIRMMGALPSEAEIGSAARNAVGTFLAAFGTEPRSIAAERPPAEAVRPN